MYGALPAIIVNEGPTNTRYMPLSLREHPWIQGVTIQYVHRAPN